MNQDQRQGHLAFPDDITRCRCIKVSARIGYLIGDHFTSGKMARMNDNESSKKRTGPPSPTEVEITWMSAIKIGVVMALVFVVGSGCIALMTS